jgi:hypothetical protein
MAEHDEARRVDLAAWRAAWDRVEEWEARLEVVEQLRALFVRL